MENLAPRGILLVDKPSGITSHGVVAQVRRAFGTKKVGHAGTLDPAATGLLILGIGASTKLLTWLVGADKTYQAIIRLGAATVTDDAESEITQYAPAGRVTEVTDTQINDAVATFIGKIQQVPSAVSAIKVAGKRAYDLVRAGEEVKLKSREVTVSRFEIKEIIRESAEFIDVTVQVDCSSGTYIRALARDLGKKLGTFGHLTFLRRTRIGNWQVQEAVTLDDLNADTPLISDAEVAKNLMGSILLSTKDVEDISHGRRIEASGKTLNPIGAESAVNIDNEETQEVAAISAEGELTAIGRIQAGRFIPNIVFNAGGGK